MASDTWDDSAAYDAYVGRWSRPLAAEFVRWLDVRPEGTWLDVGCGTGALAGGILETAAPRLVIGCDPSPAYLSVARARTADPRARFVEANLVSLPRQENGFDAVVAGLVLNFMTNPLEGVAAMAARARRGGLVAAYVWDYSDGMEMMRIFWDAARTLDPAAEELDEGVRFPLCRPEPLRDLFERAGLREVEVRPMSVATAFRDFDDYWTPFLGGQGPAPGYVAALAPARRDRLRGLVRSRVPANPDGTISLAARAWAAKGIVQ